MLIVKAVVIWHKRQKTNMSREAAKNIHLTTMQYRESEVDWLSQHPNAYLWLCDYKALDEFRARSDRNHGNWLSKPSIQNFGADGHAGKANSYCVRLLPILFLKQIYGYVILYCRILLDGIDPIIV